MINSVNNRARLYKSRSGNQGNGTVTERNDKKNGASTVKLKDLKNIFLIVLKKLIILKKMFFF